MSMNVDMGNADHILWFLSQSKEQISSLLQYRGSIDIAEEKKRLLYQMEKESPEHFKLSIWEYMKMAGCITVSDRVYFLPYSMSSYIFDDEVNFSITLDVYVDGVLHRNINFCPCIKRFLTVADCYNKIVESILFDGLRDVLYSCLLLESNMLINFDMDVIFISTMLDLAKKSDIEDFSNIFVENFINYKESMTSSDISEKGKFLYILSEQNETLNSHIIKTSQGFAILNEFLKIGVCFKDTPEGYVESILGDPLYTEILLIQELKG